MSFAFELVIFICIFALAVGLFGNFLGTTEEGKRKQRAAHEARRYARQPWDDAEGRSNR
ncbi:MAG TPA: hypothetical protein VKS43_14300 [Burkholderiales bacterium]|nr:hypothetical protein [Burkholderiales bacterium]